MLLVIAAFKKQVLLQKAATMKGMILKTTTIQRGAQLLDAVVAAIRHLQLIHQPVVGMLVQYLQYILQLSLPLILKSLMRHQAVVTKVF